MDVDFGDVGKQTPGGEDLTSELLQKFSCLSTNDREVLVERFKALLDEKCSESTAEFWLDMNNWNLQAALCAYLDFDDTTSNYMMKLPSVQISPDVYNQEQLPNSSFTYQCTVTNSGDEVWPLGCSLRFCGGQVLSQDERLLLPTIAPGQSFKFKLNLTSPEKAGLYMSQWRCATITGQFFGETLYIIVNVTDELSQVTKQLSQAHIDNLEPVTTTSTAHLPSFIPMGYTPLTDISSHQQQQPTNNLMSCENNGGIGCMTPDIQYDHRTTSTSGFSNSFAGNSSTMNFPDSLILYESQQKQQQSKRNPFDDSMS